MKHEDVEHLRDAMIEEMTAPLLAAAESLMASPSIALGITESGGTYRLAVRVRSLNTVSKAMMAHLEKMSGGEMEVRETGPIVGLQLWRHRRNRPLLIGSSCANRAVSTGTLGCFVRRNEDSVLCMLSNNHVLVRDNAVGADGKAQPGTQLAVDQPSPDDFAGGAHVGQLVRGARLRIANNLVDAAIARVTESNPPPDLFTITGFPTRLSNVTAPSVPNQTVHKIGRTTELRTGRVSAHGLKNLTVTIDGVSRGFDQQIEIESVGPNFSEGGDSGSIVFNDAGRPVGLLFGGSSDNRLSYANPIDDVLTALGVTIAT